MQDGVAKLRVIALAKMLHSAMPRKTYAALAMSVEWPDEEAL